MTDERKHRSMNNNYCTDPHCGCTPPPRFWRVRDAILEAIATVEHWLRLS